MVTNFCFEGNCTAATQHNLVQFLNCFEGENGRDKSVTTAEKCAGSSGLDWSTIDGCYSSPAKQAAAYGHIVKAAIQKGDFQAGKCLPWVVIDGKVFSDPTNEACVPASDSKELLKAICGAYNGTKVSGRSQQSCSLKPLCL